jgi:hypothetical protein
MLVAHPTRAEDHAAAWRFNTLTDHAAFTGVRVIIPMSMTVAARSDLQARSKASPIVEVAASSNQTFWIGVIAISTSEKHERERRSVSQSPRLEAVSVILKPAPLDGELSDQN